MHYRDCVGSLTYPLSTRVDFCFAVHKLDTFPSNICVDAGAAVNGKWDVTRCAGMARFPLPEIWPRSTRPLKYCNG